MSTATPSGSGERNAVRGLRAQYLMAAQIIYRHLKTGTLRWIGVADENAGNADDIVIGMDHCVTGYQYKSALYPQPFSCRTVLLGSENGQEKLIDAWQKLRTQFPTSTIAINWVTENIPNTKDKLVEGVPGTHSAAFLHAKTELQDPSLETWKDSRWGPFVSKLALE